MNRWTWLTAIAVTWMSIMSAISAEDRFIITTWNTNHLSQITQPDTGIITTSVWSNDGRMFVAGTIDEIRIYRAGEEEPLIIPNQQRPYALALRDDGGVLASVDDTQVLRLWDTASGALVDSWNENTVFISNMRFLQHTDELMFQHAAPVSDIYDMNVVIWHYLTPQPPLRMHMNPILYEDNAVINMSGTLLATRTLFSQNRTGLPVTVLSIRDIETGQITFETSEIRETYSHLLFSPTDPAVLITLGASGVVRLWNVIEGDELFALTLPENRITMAVFSTDGSQVVTGGLDNTVRVWDVGSGALLEVYSDQPWSLLELRTTSDSRILGFSDASRQPVVWDTRTGQVINQFTIKGKSESGRTGQKAG